MIFDYILNNRFYTQNDDAANPYADIIPKAPHNRLETFLNMIVGDIPLGWRRLNGYAAVDPIKPISEMEYWLNEIAAAKDGNPWKDAAGGIEAKLVTAQIAEDVSFPMYMLDLDLGIDELPYTKNRLWFTVEGNYFLTGSVESAAVDTEPMPQIAENTYGVTSPINLKTDSEEPTELSNMLPGIFVVGIQAFFYQLAGETIHAQMLFGLIEGDGVFNDPTDLYSNADSIRINVSFDHCTEIEEAHGA